MLYDKPLPKRCGIALCPLKEKCPLKFEFESCTRYYIYQHRFDPTKEQQVGTFFPTLAPAEAEKLLT